MVVLRKLHRRATSVPVDDDEPFRIHDSPLEFHRSRMISNAVLDNADALSAASKRNDAQLMRDVNARLANVVAAPSQPVLTRRRNSFTPAYTGKPPQHSNTVTLKVSSTSVEGGKNDIDRSVDLLMPVTARALRAGSVPPVTSLPILPLEEMNLVKGRLVQNGPVIVAVNGPKTLNGFPFTEQQPVVTQYVVERAAIPESFYYYPQSVANLTPTADLAVRQAHRNLDRIEHELRSDSTLAPPPSPIPPIRTYATLDIGPRRRSSSYQGPISGIRSRSPSPRRVIYTVPVGPLSYSSYRYIPSYYASLPTYGTGTDYISTLPPLKPRSSYCSNPLSSLGGSSANPIKEIWRSVNFTGGSNKPVSTVINSRRPPSASLLPSADLDALVQSARVLPDVPTKTYYSVSPASSYVPKNFTMSSPASNNTTGLPPVVKPRVSQTRQRVRDLLCKVKNDPHYFD